MLDIPRERTTSDKGRNNYGKKLLEFCKYNGFFILNGRIGEDRNKGRLTCKNVSTVDFCISNSNLLKYFENFEVLDFCSLYSDVHSPLEITLLFTSDSKQDKENIGEQNFKNIEKVSSWDREKGHLFCKNIDDAKVEKLKDELGSVVKSELNKNKINYFVETVSEIFIGAAKATLGTTQICVNKKSENTTRKNNKEWFNIDCKFARQNYRKLKRKCKSNKSGENLNAMKASEKYYKKKLNQAIKIHHKKMSKEIDSLKSQNSKTYWQLLKRDRHVEQPNIPIGKLFDFFKQLNSAPENIDQTYNFFD